MADSLLITVDEKPAVSAMDALPVALSRRITRENITSANRIVLDARRRVRVRFGFLLQAIDWVQNAQGDIWIGVSRKLSFVIPGTRRFSGQSAKARPNKYAHLIERGTVHADPFPFMKPAVLSERSSHDQRVFNALVDAANDVGLR